jgi:ribonuclease-3
MGTQGFEKLQDILGYRFKDLHWLERAMTHSSTNESYSYQRLEFLGDRVLGLVIAHALFDHFRDEKEGGLAKRHTALVQRRTCAMIAQAHGFGEFMIMSAAEEEAGGRDNENILSDIMESILGAIYIDGGYDPVRDVVLRLWGENIKTLVTAPQDPKTELQEWVQAQGYDLPVYEIVQKSGPDHAPVFTVRLSVHGTAPVEAEGPSRRQAEKTVARTMLKNLKKS